MADPRATLSFEGIDYQAETYNGDSTIVFDATKAGGSASAGLAVTVTGNGQCGLTADANPLLGKLIKVEWDGKCTVQTDGYCTLPSGNGQTLIADSRPVGALGASSAKGYIRNANSAVAAETVAAGDALVVDASVATAVVVNL